MAQTRLGLWNGSQRFFPAWICGLEGNVTSGLPTVDFSSTPVTWSRTGINSREWDRRPRPSPTLSRWPRTMLRFREVKARRL